MVSKAKYEDQYTKGKMGKRLDDCKERYHKATRKLHSTHNEYGDSSDSFTNLEFRIYEFL